MTTIIRIDPPLPFDTPKGKAMAHFLTDYGCENHHFWTCFLNETGQCWTFRNTEVRLEANYSMRPQEAK